MSVSLWVLFLVVDGAGLWFGVRWLWRSRGSPWRDIPRLLAFGFVLSVAAAPLALIATQSHFGIVRIECHVLFCVLAPLAMARGGWHLLHGRRWAPGALLLLGGLAMDAVYVHARHVEPFDLQIRRHEIVTDRLPRSGGRLKVIVLADLQTDEIGAYERSVFEEIDAERADLILLAGDYLHIGHAPDYARERKKLVALLRSLRHEPRYGIYAVKGDTEPSGDVLKGSGVPMLQDQTVRPPDSMLQIVGLSYRATFEPVGEHVLEQVRRFGGFSIVFGHRPNFMEPLVEHGSDVGFLCVSGHTHGGQVVIPGFGPPATSSPLPRSHAGGLHRCGEAWVVVSRGVGMERGVAPRIRFLCPPELVVVEIEGIGPRPESAAGSSVALAPRR
jgi:predicted MPP superfamily phosphohydrolase